MNGPFRHICPVETGGFLSRLRALAIANFALILLTFSLSAEAASDVRIDLAEEDGYGRLIFTFSGEVPSYRASVEAGILVLEFGRGFAIDPNDFLRHLPRYVAMVRQSGDLRSIRAALTTDFSVNAMRAENAVYVDLLPPGWKGAPPPLPADVLARIEEARKAKEAAKAAELAAKAQGIVEPEVPLPGLSVRMAKREGLARLVFDWNQPVLYSLVQRQGLATITFDRTAKVDLAQLRADPPPQMAGVAAVEHDGRLAIVLTLKPGVTVTDFREDMSIVLDLKSEGDLPLAAPKEEAAGKSAPKKLLPELADAKAPVEEAPKDISPVAEAETVAPASSHPVPGAARPEGKAVLRYAAGRNGMDLVIDWPEPVGAAVFERADRLWIVFDRELPIDISAVSEEEHAPYGQPESVTVAGGAALVVPLKDQMLLAAVNEAASWRVSAGEAIPTTGRPIAVSREWREDGRGAVAFDLRAPRKVLRVRDPLVGDEIVVVTANGPGQAMQISRSFVEFQALQTAQGLAIVPVADDLNVAASPDNVLVTRHDGLTLSTDDHREWQYEGNGPVAQSAPPAEMHFAEWRQAPGETFIERRQYHLAQLASAQSHEMGERRLAYGRFLLAYGLAPEARAMLVAAKEADSRFGIDPSFRATLGVSSALSGRYGEAIRELSGPSLDNSPHAAAWRGLARASLGHWEAARSEFALAGAITDAFGEELRVELRSLAALASLKSGDVLSAEQYAAGFPAHAESTRAKASIVLTNAMIADAHDRKEKAVALYDAAIENGYPPVAARARYGKMMLLHRKGEVDDKALARELESLRYAWRGDGLELDVLTQLAELHLRGGNVGEALRLMRIATDNFPDSDEAHRMNMRMSDIFADYYLSDAASEMTPVQALSFFEAFKELTPIGQRGDEMIRDLAERLVSVDLLEQAAHLLDYQVANRLHGGVAKAQVAARLASIFLADQKPDRALAALRATKQNLLPTELAEARLLLEARALADLRQYDNAMDLLEGRSDPAAKRLRADILWNAGRWEDAGPVIEIALGDSWKGNAPMSGDNRLLVMRAAIAYSLAEDEAGLGRLRVKYGEAMSQSADADAFAVLSEPITKQGVAFREMASRIASIDTLDRFLASLKIDESVAVN